VITTRLEGEARHVGATLGRRLRELTSEEGPQCLLYGGETTVTLQGDGRGGRSHELAVAAARELDGVADVLLLAAGTDGIDGSTHAAGGVVDGHTAERARTLQVDLDDALLHNDTGPALEALDAQLITGPTGTNVMDLVILMSRPIP
jgi:glycerate-2-kinase